MIYFTQKTYPKSAGAVGATHGDVNMHPFKVLVANGLVYVVSGKVYALKDSRVHDAVTIKLSATDLGDPFLNETMPTIAVQNDKWLWLKVEFDPDDVSVSSADIVYETEANAIDTYILRWVKIAKTFTSGLVQQVLKENVFLVGESDAPWFSVLKTGNDSVTVSGGHISTVDYSGLGSLGGTFPSSYLSGLALPMAPVIVAGLSFASLVDGDEVWLKLEYTQQNDTVWVADSGLDNVPIQFVSRYCTSGAVEKKATGFDPATSGTGYGWVHLATIRIVSGKLRVRQHHVGVVTAFPHYMSP